MIPTLLGHVVNTLCLCFSFLPNYILSQHTFEEIDENDGGDELARTDTTNVTTFVEDQTSSSLAGIDTPTEQSPTGFSHSVFPHDVDSQASTITLSSATPLNRVTSIFSLTHQHHHNDDDSNSVDNNPNSTSSASIMMNTVTSPVLSEKHSPFVKAKSIHESSMAGRCTFPRMSLAIVDYGHMARNAAAVDEPAAS
eukprot:PhM_4_TR13952/c0_g1_i2/m.101311